MKKYLFISLFLWVVILPGHATHFTSAEIRLEKRPDISNRSYDVVMTAYYRASSLTGIGAGLDYFSQPIDIRDANRNVISTIDLWRVTAQDGTLNNGFSEPVLRRVFKATYTFESSGILRIFSFTGENRRASIENIVPPSGGMDNYDIYVETFVYVDGTSAGNSTPMLTAPPLDVAALNRVYTYDVGAVDPEGDSLSYRLVALRHTQGELIPEQWFPDDPRFGNSTLKIDPVTGILTWDAPRTKGLFNVAIEVSEWRNGMRISFSVRDFPIDVHETDNNPPIITQIEDTCVITNQELRFDVKIEDPDHHPLNYAYYGAPKLLSPPITTENVVGQGTWNMTFDYVWTPGCDAVQRLPHAIKTQGTDNPPLPFTPDLTTIKSTLIKVYPQSPDNLSATYSTVDNTVLLEWDVYPCAKQHTYLNIYRIVCDSVVVPFTCDLASPEDYGYVKVGTVPSHEVSFIDGNSGYGLRKGKTYYYAISAELTYPSRIAGPLSGVVKAVSEFDAPIITRVSVVNTSESNGEIAVHWVKPFGFDETAYPGPYTYSLYRATGLTGDNFDATPVFAFTSTELMDTVFYDTGLNTKQFPYAYKVDLAFNGEIIQSEFATSVWLTTEAMARRIDLTWQDNSVWFRADTLHQVVWRDSLVPYPIDSVRGLDYYAVRGLTDGDSVCFFVETRYVFCVDSINEMYVSYSNVACDMSLDTVPPCPPVLTVLQNDCENPDWNTPAKNELSWVDNDADECDDPIQYYKVYYKKRVGDVLVLLDSVLYPTHDYTHANIPSYAYCYAVTAVDMSGNESVFSNVACNENCVFFALPNIFTPNGDGKNDYFVPLPKSRSVEKVVFSVYNRWGEMVYYSEDDPWINWDGKTLKGDAVADGTYYFTAEVYFDQVNIEASKTDFKGWVLITR